MIHHKATPSIIPYHFLPRLQNAMHSILPPGTWGTPVMMSLSRASILPMAVSTSTRGTYADGSHLILTAWDGDEALHGSRAGVHARFEDLRRWLGLRCVSGAAANASLYAKVLA
jgi:hypothetical protein